MAKLLYITANPKPVERSFSLQLGEKFLNAYKDIKPDDEIITIDLYNTDIPEIDFDLLYVIDHLKSGITPEQMSEQTRSKFARYNQVTDQFIQADKYIFVTPMWNLGLPPRVKTYIDAICVAGKSFKYTERGPVGLLKNKKCVHLHASGGFHSGSPANHADPYLRDIMVFMGVTDYKSIVVEGYMAMPDQTEACLQKAYQQIPAVAKWFA